MDFCRFRLFPWFQVSLLRVFQLQDKKRSSDASVADVFRQAAATVVFAPKKIQNGGNVQGFQGKSSKGI